VLKIHVGPGEEVIEALTRRLRDGGVRRGAIVSVIGAVDECRIGNMRADDAGQDVVTDYVRPFELSGTGEVEDGKPHIHCVLGAEGNQTYSGHLHSAKVGSWFVNVFVVPTP
jgi:predicted DNA-binding protein with PD1-like motif